MCSLFSQSLHKLVLDKRTWCINWLWINAGEFTAWNTNSSYRTCRYCSTHSTHSTHSSHSTVYTTYAHVYSTHSMHRIHLQQGRSHKQLSGPVYCLCTKSFIGQFVKCSVHVALHVMLQHYTNLANTSMCESLAPINSLPTIFKVYTVRNTLQTGASYSTSIVGPSALLLAMWYIA